MIAMKTTAFDGVIEADSNIDWLTFILENINY